ncbi:MAG: radical SAM family heme chaperone HemW, partial [Sneathiella sp.]|nr:radical SAM family heme chaperone HemW [Sneathiella sp.]
VGALIEGVKSRFTLADDIEISLEANPTSAEAEYFKGYRAVGVNRLSMGVQSLQDEALRFLGREHSVKEALQTIELAREIFPNISFDLIYALPNQTVPEWKADLNAALSLAGDHISLYQLTIEPNTGFAGSLRRGEFTLPKDEIAEEMYEVTQDICALAGLPSYEISNHAKAGAECWHNLTYWRYGAYLGVGPGAHGRLPHSLGRIATEQIKKPEKWLAAVQQHGHGTQIETEVFDETERAEELLLMGLRLREGVWFSNFEALVGRPFDTIVPEENLCRLVEAGFLLKEKDRLLATENGRFVLNSVLGHLLS